MKNEEIKDLKEEELYKKALGFIGINTIIKGGSRNKELVSEELGKIKFDESTIKTLEKSGFSYGKYSGGYILTDNQPQRLAYKTKSVTRFWTFNATKEDNDNGDTYYPTLSLHVKPVIDYYNRGISLVPHVTGASICATSYLSQQRIFQIAEKVLKETDSIIQRISNSTKGTIIVPWSVLDLHGLKHISCLFKEFVGFMGGKNAILDIASSTSVFNPYPFPIYENHYAPEKFHSLIFNNWIRQLKKYINDITPEETPI